MNGELSDNDTVLTASGNYSLIGQMIGNYKVTDVLGQGGFGAVYAAEDTKLGRTVALKFLRQADQKFHAELFEREARALGALSKHNNIVQIHAWDEYNGANFFVLEYMSSSVADEIKKYPDGMPLDKAVRIIAECADALAFAHEAEILHRDIKAQNILLEELDGTAKIADFGLARICGTSAQTIEGSAIGSPVYMAPEQARGQTLTHLCDIYSLGVTLYELLSGKPSVAGSSILEVLEKVRNNDRVPLRNQKPGLPDALYAIVDRATAPEPANRYQSAADMAEDLRRVDLSAAANSAPASAVPPPAASVSETLTGQELPPLPVSPADPVLDSAPKTQPTPAPAQTPAPQAQANVEPPQPAPAGQTSSSPAGSGTWKLVAAAAVVIMLSGATGYGMYALGSRETTPAQSDADVAADSPAGAVDGGSSQGGGQPPAGGEPLDASVPFPQETLPWLNVNEAAPESDSDDTTPPVMAEEESESAIPEEPNVTAKKEEKVVPQNKPTVVAEPSKPVVEKPATVAAKPKPVAETPKSKPAVEKPKPAPVEKDVLTKEAASVPSKSDPEVQAAPASAEKSTVDAVKSQPAVSEPASSESTTEQQSGKATMIVNSDSGTQDGGESQESLAGPVDSQTTVSASPTESGSDDGASASDDIVVKRRGKSTVIIRSGSDSDDGSSQETVVEPTESQPAASPTETKDTSEDDSKDTVVRRRGKSSGINND